ncbi:MAG TPA: serine/threonine-protein kinase [Oculatellaceae cyanobacterium]
MTGEKTERAQLELRCPNCGHLKDACVCTADVIEPNDPGADGDSAQKNDKELPHPLAGQHYIGGKYKILSLIGRGGMGCVYKVKHEALDKIYALKILNRDVTTEIKTLRRFDQEAKAVGSMEHENLIGVHDYGTSDDGTPFLVMDYLDGVSLSDEIEKHGFINEKRAQKIFQGVANGLSHAHEQGVVHRDLKPGNIMLVTNALGEEQPIIVDFGLAKRQTVDKNLTQTGDIFGTPLYMSPEQCMGNPVDQRSDIYSLGCVMYESLSGKSPFEDVNAVKTIVKHLNDDAEPLAEACKQKLSSGWERLVMQCLEKDAKNRPQTAKSLSDSLKKIGSGESLHLIPIIPHKKRSLFLHAARYGIAGITGALIFVAVYWLYLKPPLQSIVTFELAKQAGQKRDYVQAVKLVKRALAESEEDKAPVKDKLDMHRSLFHWVQGLRRPNEAAAEAKTVVQMAEQQKNLDVVEEFLPLLANYEITTAMQKQIEGQFVTAIDEEASVFPARPERLFKLCDEAGREFSKAQDAENARKYFKKAVSIFEATNAISPGEAAATYRSLIEAEDKLHMLTEAHDSIEKLENLVSFLPRKDSKLQAWLKLEREQIEKRLKETGTRIN